MCKSIDEAILAVIIIIFALWETALSGWIVLLAGVLLLIHSFTCKRCFVEKIPTAPAKTTKKR